MSLGKRMRILKEMLNDKRAMADIGDEEKLRAEIAKKLLKADKKEVEVKEKEVEAKERQAEAEEKKAEAMEDQADTETERAEAGNEQAKEPSEKEEEMREEEKNEEPAAKPEKERPAKPKGDTGFAQKVVVSGGSGGAGGAGKRAVVAPGLALLIGSIGLFFLYYAEVPPLAYVSFGLLIVLGFMLIFIPREQRNLATNLVMFAVLLGTIGMFIFFSLPHMGAALQKGLGQRAIEDVPQEAEKGFRTAIKNFVETYQAQVEIATGKRIDGKVDAKKKEVNLELLPPLTPNPERIKINELLNGKIGQGGKLAQGIGALVKGLSEDVPLDVTTVCAVQTKKESDEKLGLDLNPGEKQPLTPSTLGGHFFETPVTCYPTFPDCGRYVVTISSEADNMRADAYLDNYVIRKDIMEQRLLERAREVGGFTSEKQMISALYDIFPGQLGEYQSISDPGLVKAIMTTQNRPLIGIDESTPLTLRLAFENMKKGWIRNVKSVQVTIPPFFTVLSQEFCPGWDVKQNPEGGTLLTLSESALNSADFSDVSKGKQKSLPSCHLTPTSDTSELLTPTALRFLLSVEYDYVVQAKYEIDIRDKEGNACKPGQKEEAKA